MRLKLQPATSADVPELVELRNAASEHLTSIYGPGSWSAATSERGVHFSMRVGTVYVARHRGKLIATLTLSTRKPWAIDKKFFTSSSRPLYLTAMTVHPRYQGHGVGAACLQEAQRIAVEWPGGAIRLDAWDGAAGAGDFYKKCGYREMGRTTYRGTKLIYYERVL